MSQMSIQLFCFAYAGASASVYSRWKRQLPGWIEVVPVEYPGRGRRMSERLQTTLPGLIESVARPVQERARPPFAFFGHSMGSVVAFELAQYLQARRAPVPLLVVASGSRAPSCRDRERFAGLQTDEELIAELQRLNGTPASVLEDRELMELTLPPLRADFQVLEGYECPASRRISCPIDVFGGADDPDTTPETLEAWKNHTLGASTVSMLPGGHFFIHEHQAQLLGMLERRLGLLAER